MHVKQVFKINENTQAIPITSSEIMIKFVSIVEDYEWNSF